MSRNWKLGRYSWPRLAELVGELWAASRGVAPPRSYDAVEWRHAREHLDGSWIVLGTSAEGKPATGPVATLKPATPLYVLEPTGPETWRWFAETVGSLWAGTSGAAPPRAYTEAEWGIVRAVLMGSKVQLVTSAGAAAMGLRVRLSELPAALIPGGAAVYVTRAQTVKARKRDRRK